MNNNMNKKPLFDRRGKSGIYSVVLSLILLAVLVVVNMIVGSLPSKITMIDTSSTGQYDISGTSESFIAGIKDNITLYYICPDGYEDTSLETFVERYASMSPKISVVNVDPVDDPSFLEEYQATDLSENSIIVESGKRFKVIDYYDFFRFYCPDIDYTMTYDEYASSGYMYEYYYGYTFSPVQYFDSVLTLGIEYVCVDSVPSMYLLNGHGEAELASVITQNLDYFGFTYQSLNLALGEEIPADCTCIVIHNPTSDLTALEAATLSSYLENGGNMLLITSGGVEEFTNLSSLTAKMGLSAEAGVVNEGDSSAHYPNVATYIYPTVSSSHEAISYIAQNNFTVMLPNAHGINITTVDGVTATPLLTTTDKAYTLLDGAKGEAGVKNLGVIAESGESKLCWISAGNFISDAIISNTQGGNFYAFYMMTRYLTGNYTSSLADIPGIELSEPTISTTATDANIWGTVLIFIIPGAVLASGIGYTVYRRRR